MKKTSFILSVILIISICLNGSGLAFAQSGVQGVTYLVAIYGVTDTNQVMLANDGVTYQSSSEKVIASVTATQLEHLKRQGFRVEILKSSDPKVVQSLELSNSYLTLDIIDSGQFTMRTADGRYLLFPNASTGYLSVNVDGKIYSQYSNTLSVYSALNYIDASNAMIQFKTPENILLTLHFTLNGQAVQFALESKNLDSTPHSIDARFLLDTQVDLNDGSPLYAPNIGVRTKETDFPQPPFSTWRGYDIYPNPNLVSEGTFSTQPYRAVFAWWPNAYDYEWGYTPDPNQSFYTPGYTYSPYSDSCVLLYFSMGSLTPGAQSAISTFYGVGAPTNIDKREQLISAFLRFKESVRNSILADLDAYAALEAKYYVSMRPSWKDYVSAVWTLADPLDHVSKYARLGKDAKLIQFYVDQISYVGAASTFYNSLGTLATGIPASAGEVEIRDTYIKHALLYNLTFFADGRMYHGLADYLNQIDNEYLDYISRIPDPLPAGYPADFIIAQLKEQSAGLDASSDHETFVPIYYNNQCSGMKLGTLQLLKHSMIDELAPRLEFANNVSWGATVTSIALVLGGAGLKIAGVVGAPLTVGGSTVVLIPSETALWSGVAALDLIAGAAGSIGTIGGLTIQGAMSVVSLQAVAQYANDIQFRKAIFDRTGDWLVAPGQIGAQEAQQPLDPSTVEVVGVNVPNLTLAADQASGQGIGHLTVRNSGTIKVNVVAYGDITTEMNGAMPTVGFVGSTAASLAPGETKTLSFTYSVLRSTLVRYTGYDMHLYLTAANASSSLVLGPNVAHFYAGTAAQLGSLDLQTFTDLMHGELFAGQVVTRTVSLAPGFRNTTLMLSFSQGSDFDLHLYDGQGHHTGINYDSGLVETQIPDVTYSGPTSWPEYMTVSAPFSGTLEAHIVVHNTLAGDNFDLTQLNTPALPAILDTPGQVDWGYYWASTSPIPTTSFGLQIAEGGGSRSIANLTAVAGGLTGNGTTLPTSQFICSTPSTIQPGSTVMATCTLSNLSQIRAGTYTGVIHINGKDDLGNSLSSTTNVALKVTTSYTYVYLPLSIR